MKSSVDAAPGSHLAVPRQRRALQGADDRGPHRHDPPPGCPGAADRIGGLLADLVALALHPVLLDPLGADRLEGADADVEGHPRDLDAGGRDLLAGARAVKWRPAVGAATAPGWRAKTV